MRRLLALLVPLGVLVPASVQALPTSPGVDDAQALTASAAQPAVGLESRRVRIDVREVKRDLRVADVVALPTPTGGVEEFAVEPTQVMEPALEAAHPELKTFTGRSVDDPSLTVALDVTPLGVNASVRGAQSWTVEPVGAGGKPGHRVSTETSGDPLVEPLLPESPGLDDARARGALAAQPVETPLAGEVVRRTYRLAMLSDPSYADYWGSENVLAAKVSLVNRVNQVYNDDFGTRFLLVDDTERLSLATDAQATGAGGPCGAAPCFDVAPPAEPGNGMLDRCGIDTLGRARLVLGNLIGADAYDVGHVVLGVNGGGVAWLGVAGRDYAAGGCTALAEPRGDFFAIDYVAHELGHQFNALHTFNGAGDFCGPNGSDASIEPGSGSSVMAYAGICGADDLQPHTDPYFSQHTIGEVSGFVADDQADVVAVQQVTLDGFDTDGDTVTLAVGDRTATLTRGPAYTRGAVRDAVAGLTGRAVRIARWDYDPFLAQQVRDAAAVGQPSDAGFQVVYADDLDPEDGTSTGPAPDLTATGGAGVEARVVDVALGGESRNGGATEASGNQRPVVEAPKRKTLPVRTPFRLEGVASDPDGDPLTFSWEQDDPGIGTALFSNDKVFGPLFRQFSDNARVSTADALMSPSPGQNTASTEPVRWFPDLEQVLRGRTNADTGRCPRVNGSRARDRVLDCYSEFLPTERYRGAADVGRRTMHFRLTARDGHPDGGGTSYADVALRVKRSAGPFLVRSQRTGRDVAAGSTMGVRWKVNGTRPLAKKVRILLSIDDGRTWGTVLANNTRNDGKKKVRLPEGVRADAAWVMVEARGNYFFDASDEAFAIR